MQDNVHASDPTNSPEGTHPHASSSPAYTFAKGGPGGGRLGRAGRRRRPRAPPSAEAAETAPIGFGAGTTGGGSATAVTVSTLDAFKTAVTGDSAKVVRVDGLISLSGQVDIGSNTTVLGVGSSSGFTGAGCA